MKIAILTAGCSHNLSDSETMAHYLSLAGYEVFFERKDDVKLIIYNTCTVKNPTEDKFFSQLKKEKLPLVIAGCISQAQKNDEWLKRYSAIGVDQLDKIVEVVEATIEGKVKHFLQKKTKDDGRDFVPIIRKNKLIGIIPILQGCLGSCHFCKTKFARGNLKSHNPELIVKQIRHAKTQGIKEIWLVSEDNGAYGLDIETNLPELLRKIAEIGEGLKIRIGMLNPEYANKYKEELIEILKHDCFYKFFHIPVQCGNDEVLKDMVRPYTIFEFEETLKVLYEAYPNISIATDIICGYPTETKEQFQDTMTLLKKNNFAAINISKFYPRKGTKAASLQLIPTKEVKERSKELTVWFVKQNYNKKYEGKVVEVFVDEIGKNNSFIGRTNEYKQVIIQEANENILGSVVKVKIETTTRDDIRGKII